MPGEITVRVTSPDGRGQILTDHVISASCSTAAVGGFGSAQITLAGHFTSQHIAWLSLLEISYGDITLFEGYVEDEFVDITADGTVTTIQAFGPSRALDLCSVSHSWIERSFPDFAAATSSALAYVQLVAPPAGGWRIAGKNVASGGSANTYFSVYRPNASGSIRWHRVKAKVDNNGSANKTGYLKLEDGAGDPDFTGEGQADLASIGAGYRITIGWSISVASTFTDSDYVDFTDLRAYGVIVDDEDNAAGSTGLYGGRILADLATRIGLVPGEIELGSEFAVPQCDASTRLTAREVLSQVVPFYQREYRVWEGGQFDWVTPAYTDPDWSLTLDDLDGLTIEASIGGKSLTTYVLYTDATLHAGWAADEEVATSQDARNPWAATATQADRILSPGFSMTTRSASALASKYATIEDGRPAAAGRCSLSLDAPITRRDGQTLPAAAIRGGDDIAIIDLPVDDSLATGRDGQTIFHIAATQTDLTERTITLDIEGQTRRTDVLLARLAAATRVVTG